LAGFPKLSPNKTLQKIIVSQKTNAGIADFLCSIRIIESLLYGIDKEPDYLRSHLSLTTGHPGIDNFLGFHNEYHKVIPSGQADGMHHRVISVLDLFNLVSEGLPFPSDSIVEIQWDTPDYQHSSKYLKYIKQFSIPIEPLRIKKSLMSSPARHLSLTTLSYLGANSQECVFCNIRRGEVSFVSTKVISSYLCLPIEHTHYYTLTGEFVNYPFKNSRHGFRFIPIEKINAALSALVEQRGRDKLFVVCSTDGYSKFLSMFSKSPHIQRPVDNDLLDILQEEFAYLKQTSNIFLPGDSIFHTEFSIVYAAISNILISGPSAFPGHLKRFLGFGEFSNITLLSQD
jgi:hypothetical protein